MFTLPESIPRTSQSRTLSGATDGAASSSASPSTFPESMIDLGQSTVPKVLGEYDVETMIAPGGMGIVYRARHRSSGRSVAIKTLRRDLVATPDMMARFRREVQAGELDHPNVMPVLDAGESDGRPYLVMPLARDSLAHQMARFQDPNAAARLLMQVARGVDAAHRAGVVHRDLKPGNILLEEDNTPRVADFGLAKIIDDLDTMSLTCTGAVLGTPPYMAPEQAFGAKTDIGPAVDVWALGIILYELVTQQRPFDGPSRQATLERVRHIDPPSPRNWKPNLDRRLETIILTCLQKDPKHRYSSAGAFADDLDAWLNGRSIQARRRRWAAWWRPIAASWKTWAPATIGVAALLLVIIGLATMLNPGGNSKNLLVKSDYLDELQREVAAGRPVRLIGPGQPPQWYEWEILKNGSGRVSFNNGVTVIESPNVDTLTLFKPAPPRYRIDAEIRPIEISAAPSSGFGLTFGYRRIQGNGTVHHGMYSFSEICKSVNAVPVELRLDYAVHIPTSKPKWLSLLRDQIVSAAPRTRPTSYSVTVSDFGLVGSRNHEPPLSVDWPEIKTDLLIAEQKMNMPKFMNDVDPSGPVGIGISRCAVEIHSLVLTPLPSKE